MKNVERAITMLNELMNETNTIWANLPEHRYDLTFGWRYYDDKEGIYEVGPNRNTAIHKVKEICDILEVNECVYYAVQGENEYGEPAPCIRFF